MTTIGPSGVRHPPSSQARVGDRASGPRVRRWSRLPAASTPRRVEPGSRPRGRRCRARHPTHRRRDRSRTFGEVRRHPGLGQEAEERIGGGLALRSVAEEMEHERVRPVVLDLPPLRDCVDSAERAAGSSNGSKLDVSYVPGGHGAPPSGERGGRIDPRARSAASRAAQDRRRSPSGSGPCPSPPATSGMLRRLRPRIQGQSGRCHPKGVEACGRDRDVDAASPGSDPYSTCPLASLRDPDPHRSGPGATAYGRCHA